MASEAGQAAAGRRTAGLGLAGGGGLGLAGGGGLGSDINFG